VTVDMRGQFDESGHESGYAYVKDEGVVIQSELWTPGSLEVASFWVGSASSIY
jgi:hypothetical protein